jgi:hypothetical protein
VFALISIPPRGAWHGIAAVRSLFWPRINEKYPRVKRGWRGSL